MEDIFLLVEHSRDRGEVHVLGWFSTETEAREAAQALEWQAYRTALKIKGVSHGAVPPGEATYRRYWVKGISRYHANTLTASGTLH
ncbi:hypothetical protein [Pseudomonas sp. KNUC1026]|uniref:hypothetical protein n=1 Tax=Pseudomonas sp. KNUC1026 TaxID=2893890 RepID=UPI001F2D1CAB|nr:hypothetical protein [Pseudomonas sp. KNUC1026]UFH51484.1 hypothetical protein LN139_11165 [Pseudomonas sp. KNUC1026]